MKKIRIGFLDYEGTFLSTPKKSSLLSPVRVLSRKAKKLGYATKIFKVEECQLFFENSSGSILEKNQLIRPCDVLVPRVDIVSRLDLELPFLKQFETLGIPIVNRYLPTFHAKNKLRTIQILSLLGIPVPKTVVVRKFEYLDAAVQEVGGYPVVLKSAFGSYGAGVLVVESARSLYSTLDLILEKMDSNIVMIQEFVAEAKGMDYRAFVVGDRVIASMKRIAKEGDFRSNFELGGETAEAELTEEEKDIAIRATKALGLEVSGVDLLRTNKGPVIMEVNANPGFKGLMQTTGVDVPKAIIDFAVGMIKAS